MQPKDFRYTLEINRREYVLRFAPIGWDENTLQWERSDMYYGLVRSFSFPIKFVEDGAFLLRRKLYNENVEGYALLRIEILNRDTWGYEILYEGEIDFATAVDDGTSFEVNIADKGIESRIKAYENVRYEIPFPEDALQVELPGVDRVGSSNSSISKVQNDSRYFIPTITVLDEDVQSVYVETQSILQKNQEDEFDFNTDPDWFMRINSTVPSLSINVNLVIDSQFQEYFIARITGSNGVEYYTRTIQLDGPGRFNINIQAVINNAPSNTRLYLSFVNPYPNIIYPYPRLYSFSSESRLEINYSLTTESSIATSVRPIYLFKELIRRMTGQELEVKSSLLEQWKQLTITSGDAIREIEGAKIRTSFRDFFKSIDAVLCAGFGIEDGIPTLERRDYFFRKGLKITETFGTKEFDLSIADEYIYNSVKVGYPNKDYERPVGRDEFNSSQMYSLPITRVEKTYNIESVYRADQFGVEEARIDRIDKNITQEDTKVDNDVFFIYIRSESQGGVYQVEGGEFYDTVMGVLARTSIYNLKISPKKNLMRHLEFLYSFLSGGNGFINFESAEKNAELTTLDFEGNRVSENSNINVADLSNPMFYPYIATFTTALYTNTWKLMTQNPTGFVQFEYKGTQFMGFIMNTSIDVSKNREQEFELLLSPLNDITKFIY